MQKWTDEFKDPGAMGLALRAPVLCFHSNNIRNDNKCRYSMRNECEKAVTKIVAITKGQD